MTSALQGLRVLDLSRILAGPTCTQILGDMGADIIKIERPCEGDDTRSFGPPFLKDANGQNTTESAYYLCANRNKRSVAIDIATPQGQDLIHQFLATSDILVENFKVGGLAKYGLSYDQINDRYPKLIYCSITGFGQTGPLATEPGYDFIAQGMSGFMAATGGAHDSPTKAGVAVSDYVTGLYAVIGILAALNARTHTGTGQHVDCALLDSTIAMMTNVAEYFLTTHHVPPRIGNAHSTIVPYQEFSTADGKIIVAVGNDTQFATFAATLGHPEWTIDPRFAHNTARVQNRDVLIDLITNVMLTRNTSDWLGLLRTARIPTGPILRADQVFDEPQVQARGMDIMMPHRLSPDPLHLVGSPLKLSDTPVTYRTAPPTLGQDTDNVLTTILGLSPHEIATLRDQKIIE